MDLPMVLSRNEFEAAYQYMDNIYTRKVYRPPVAYYWCKFWRSEPRETVAPEERKRTRLSRKPIACPCRVKATAEGPNIIFVRLGDGHNHDFTPNGQRANEKIANGVSSIGKLDFLQIYLNVHDHVLSLPNIRSGFAAAGLIPLSPERICEKIQATPPATTPPPPSTPLSSQSLGVR